jgi:F-type H+-transporting ATPase subunit gamma
MAKARALDRRRKSIRGIRKITRTMELISTARFKRAMDRAAAATAYTQRITALVNHLAHAGLQVTHPLLQPRPEPKRAVLLVLAANRGLCAGYNGNVVRLAHLRYRELRNAVPNVQFEVSGKRGISALRYRKIQPDQSFTHFEDKPSFAEVDVLANRYLADFANGQFDRLDVVYTKFESISRQEAVAETLLPLGGIEPSEEEHSSAEPQYDFLPSAETILNEVVPTSFKVKLFKCFLDAAVSEQIARMVAMKAATENADSMISQLSMSYNRARQGQITGELLEIIGGAEALNG